MYIKKLKWIVNNSNYGRIYYVVLVERDGQKFYLAFETYQIAKKKLDFLRTYFNMPLNLVFDENNWSRP